MSDAAATPSRPPVRRFHRAQTPRLAADQLDRQGRIATAAWLAFGDSARAAAFLNTHHDDLDARPIALATDSANGYARVTAAMQQAVGGQSGQPALKVTE